MPYGSELGIVLTPQHLTEFMCDLADVNKNSRVVDICCGSASFLVTAMNRMFKDANAKEELEFTEHLLDILAPGGTGGRRRPDELCDRHQVQDDTGDFCCSARSFLAYNGLWKKCKAHE